MFAEDDPVANNCRRRSFVTTARNAAFRRVRSSRSCGLTSIRKQMWRGTGHRRVPARSRGCTDTWLAKDSDGSRTAYNSDGSSGVVTAQEGQPLHPGRLGKADLAESWAEPSHEPSLRFLGLPHLDHDKPRCTDRRDVALQWRRPISFTGLGVDAENLVDGKILVRGGAREPQNHDL